MFTYHRDVDAKRFNHYWQEKKVIHELPSASGEALLRLAKPTFWAAAPRGPTIACPGLPTQKGCNTTPSNPLEFKSQTDNFVLVATSISR